MDQEEISHSCCMDCGTMRMINQFLSWYYGEQYDLSDVSEGTLKGLILNLLINMPMEKTKHCWRSMSQRWICTLHGKKWLAIGYRRRIHFISALSARILQTFWMFLQRTMVERIACFLTCGYTEADKLSRKSVESILKSGMRSYRACTRKEDQCKKAGSPERSCRRGRHGVCH